jgi:hypothetical protein
MNTDELAAMTIPNTIGTAKLRVDCNPRQPCAHQLEKDIGDSQNNSNGSNACSKVQGRNMEYRYSIERVCSHRSQRFQLVFALRAIELLPVGLDYAVAASQEGLIVRGETEASLERPVELLKTIYGEQLFVGELAIRYRRSGDVVEEPYMGLRVLCAPEYYDAVRADLCPRWRSGGCGSDIAGRRVESHGFARAPIGLFEACLRSHQGKRPRSHMVQSLRTARDTRSG